MVPRSCSFFLFSSFCCSFFVLSFLGSFQTTGTRFPEIVPFFFNRAKPRIFQMFPTGTYISFFKKYSRLPPNHGRTVFINHSCLLLLLPQPLLRAKSRICSMFLTRTYISFSDYFRLKYIKLVFISNIRAQSVTVSFIPITYPRNLPQSINAYY